MEQPQDSPQPLPASHLDPWLTVKPGSPLAALVAQTMDYLPGARRDALAKREAIIAALYANFALSPAVAVPLANAKLTRYDRREVVSSQLKPTVDDLQMCFLIIKHPAVFRQRRTIIEAHPRLTALFASNGVSPSDVARLPHEEVIFLRKRKTSAKRQDAEAGEQDALFDASPQDAGDLIDYADTHETRQLRDEVRAFNSFLATADIRLEGHTEAIAFFNSETHEFIAISGATMMTQGEGLEAQHSIRQFWRAAVKHVKGRIDGLSTRLTEEVKQLKPADIAALEPAKLVVPGVEDIRTSREKYRNKSRP